MKVTGQSGKALFSLVVAGVLVAGVALAILVWQRQVRVIKSDPRFHILAVKLLRTPNDYLFFGNQLEARARLYLWVRTGRKIPLLPLLLPANRSPSLIPGSVKSGRDLLQPCALAIQYRWDNAQSRPYLPSVELVDSAGQIFSARSLLSFAGRNNSQFAIWDLNETRTNGGTYRVLIKDQEGCLAELELRNLPPIPPFHLGSNAF